MKGQTLLMTDMTKQKKSDDDSFGIMYNFITVCVSVCVHACALALAPHTHTYRQNITYPLNFTIHAYIIM